MKKFFSKKIVCFTLLILFTYLILMGLISANVINSYYKGIITLALINIILAVSLNLIVGFTGQLCLGHAGFMSIGAYVSAIITQKVRSAIYCFNIYWCNNCMYICSFNRISYFETYRRLFCNNNLSLL